MTEHKPDIEAIKALLVEVFEADPGEVSAQTQFGDFPAWDSMGHMDLMMALESRFGLPITAETIAALTSVEAILTQLEAAPSD